MCVTVVYTLVFSTFVSVSSLRDMAVYQNVRNVLLPSYIQNGQFDS
jgi:hypothetical protein